jgi:hypothetical protein
MYIPHSPNSLSSHTDEIVFGPADRDGRGGSFEVDESGTAGGRRLGRVLPWVGSTGNGVATRGSSNNSIFGRIMGVEDA